MNSDDFEKRIERQTFHKVPENWRQEILGAAKTESVQRSFAPNPQPTSWWRELLWPCPQAWTGLAAVWIVILATSFTAREPKIKMVKVPPPSPEFRIAMKEQRRLYLELVGLLPREKESIQPTAPGPRSKRDEDFQIV